MTKSIIPCALISLIFCFSQSILAQNSPSSRFQIPDSLLNSQGYDSVASSTLLTTGILWDQIFPHQDFLAYRGFNDSDTAKGMDGFQTYLDLYRSAVDTSKFISYDSLRHLYESQQLGYDALPIMTFAYDFQYLKSQALDSGYISIVDSQLVVANANSNPFEKKSLWMASTRFSEVPLNDSFNIVVPGHLFLSNVNNGTDSIFSLQINFEDGLGFRTVSLNQTISVYYNGEGGKEKVVKLKWNTSTGLKFASFSWKTANTCPYPDPDPAPWPTIINSYTINYIDYYGQTGQHSLTRTISNLVQATKPYAGKKAKGKAYVRYRNDADISQKKNSKNQ